MRVGRFHFGSVRAVTLHADPGRSCSFRSGWQEDVQTPVVERLLGEGLGRVLDVGSGIGRFASAVAGTSDLELVQNGYPRTTFDAEEAAAIVAEVCDESLIEVERGDFPLVRLHDREEVAAYARNHVIPRHVVEAVTPPVTLTQRGCLV